MEHPAQSVVVLPPAGREEQMQRWGLTPTRTGDHLNGGDRRGHLADDAPVDDDADDRALEARGFLQDGGWHAVEPPKGSERGGGSTSHRGVLHPDEHVDTAALQAVVENVFGFTYLEVRSVYRQGPLTADQRELRASIDARVLEVARTGGNLAVLGHALGFPVKPNGNCRAMENAIARARKEQS